MNQSKERKESSRHFFSCSFFSSIFLLLPLGAGSRGVRLYVMVRVITCRILTGRPQDVVALRGESAHRVPDSKDQSDGENWVRTEAALRGDIAAGEIARGRKDRGVRAERGHLDTDGDGIIIAGDLADAWLLKEVVVVVVEGG